MKLMGCFTLKHFTSSEELAKQLDVVICVDNEITYTNIHDVELEHSKFQRAISEI